MKISLHVFEKKITKKQPVTVDDLNTVYARIDKALKKKILHKNTAARRKSLVARMFNSIEK
jgi:ribosomal protein S20